MTQNDLENYDAGLQWLREIEYDELYTLSHLEEDIGNGTSRGYSLDIDRFLTQAVTLNCIEAVNEASSSLRIKVCLEHGSEFSLEELDALNRHILYGVDPSTGHRIMATEYAAELGIYARFGLCAHVETLASYGTERETVKEASEGYTSFSSWTF